MLDQLVSETIITLHPDTMAARDATKALHALMDYYATQHPASYWAELVSKVAWREQRPRLIREVAERHWLPETDEARALYLGELTVMAAEACAGQWSPEQCRISAVRIDGQLRLSLVCSMEGFTA